MTAQEILTAAGSKADIAPLSAAIDALLECERDSTACGAAMIGLSDAYFVTAIRAALDCADVCGAAARVLGRTTDSDARVIGAVKQAAIAAAERSASECQKHADHHVHCRVHSQTARRAVEALSKLAG